MCKSVNKSSFHQILGPLDESLDKVRLADSNKISTCSFSTNVSPKIHPLLVVNNLKIKYSGRFFKVCFEQSV